MKQYQGWWRIGLLIMGLAVVLAACSRGAPDIEVETTRHDFGDIQQGTVATLDIPVRNTGTADLRIEAVVTSCGCTTATLHPQVIPPGGEGTLSVRYDSGLHPDKGMIRREVYIASNDPDEPEVTVVLTANVVVPGQ